MLPDPNEPLRDWSEQHVMTFVATYKKGAIKECLLSLGLCNGKELYDKSDSELEKFCGPRKHKELGVEFRKAIQHAKQDSRGAIAACDLSVLRDTVKNNESLQAKKDYLPLPPIGDLEDSLESRLFYQPLNGDGSSSSTTQNVINSYDNNKGDNNAPDQNDGKFPPIIEAPGYQTVLFWLLVGGIMALCCTVFKSKLAEWAGEEDEDEFVKTFLRYSSIPILMVFFTGAHIWVALWMNFYPLKFIGCCQIPGTNMGFPFGWQGIVPFKGLQMATMAVNMIKEKLLSVDEVFKRLEPDRMVEELQPILGKKMAKVVEEVAMEEAPRLWQSLPELVKNQIIKKAQSETPDAIRQMILDMRPEIDNLLDLEHLVVQVLLRDMALTVDVFIVCGHKEIRFIRDAGMVMGGLFGLVQMILWIYFEAWWILPVVGFIVGAITNWLGLLMIFRPIYPINFCGMTFHGRFLRRQKEVALAYSIMVSRDVLTVPRIIEELINGREKARVAEIVAKNVSRAVDRSLGPAKPFVHLTGSDALVERVKIRVAKSISDDMVEIMTEATDYMNEAFDLQKTLQVRMGALPFPDFEGTVHVEKMNLSARYIFKICEYRGNYVTKYLLFQLLVEFFHTADEVSF
jgi:uncharacterized membrane protein YheB (UPF0754 family)